MPLLIVYPRYSASSRRLMHAAQSLGWDTHRLSSSMVPAEVVMAAKAEEREQIAIFSTPPLAFKVAQQLNRILLGCPANWLTTLPKKYLRREVTVMSLGAAINAVEEIRFIKPAISKAFEAKVYAPGELAVTGDDLDLSLVVHVAQPVAFTHEFRCFVCKGFVQTLSIYFIRGQPVESAAAVAPHLLREARAFAQSVLDDPLVDYPPGFVLDVGLIEGVGWAVVEANECWAAGLYACDPVGALEVIAAGCGNSSMLQTPWNHEVNYNLTPL